MKWISCNKLTHFLLWSSMSFFKCRKRQKENKMECWSSRLVQAEYESDESCVKIKKCTTNSKHTYIRCTHFEARAKTGESMHLSWEYCLLLTLNYFLLLERKGRGVGGRSILRRIFTLGCYFTICSCCPSTFCLKVVTCCFSVHHVCQEWWCVLLQQQCISTCGTFLMSDVNINWRLCIVLVPHNWLMDTCMNVKCSGVPINVDGECSVSGFWLLTSISRWVGGWQ